MSLQERLDRIRGGFEKKAPAATLEIMHRATDDLRASRIMNRVMGEGEPAPDFTLEDSRCRPVKLSEQLLAGPVLLTFFRGDW